MRQKTNPIAYGLLVLFFISFKLSFNFDLPQKKISKANAEKKYIGMTMHPLILPNFQQFCFKQT